ncbi:ATP-binding cassette domain-containing protein [Actinocorallia longicatena]|uniref:ABC transporter domain-containing protein n=1 Tax=Actinocorallia longicatena TaxID=111803 RepID=A0ABP6QM27_9ACTN
MIVESSAIVAKGLGIRRGGRWLLRPASFGIPGGVIGIAGPAGSGKSVLLATLATLRRPQTGTVELFGEPVTTRTALRRARARIGFLPSDARWASGSTVTDFVSYAAYYQRRPSSSVRRVLDGLDLADVASWQLNELPADLRVRAGLAAACVHAPDLAFLDAPLSGLPAHAVRDLVPLLGTVAPTVVVTAESAADLGWCDRVYLMDAGRLALADRVTARLVRPVFRPPQRTMPHIAAAWSRAHRSRGALAHA